MQFSKLGHKFTAHSGILQLMDDLGKAIAGSEEVCMLGGGNPSHIPQIEARLREQLQQILATPGRFEHMVGDYASPQGDTAFIEDLAVLLQRACGWNVGPGNIALTNSSQTAFFLLFNLFAGDMDDGTHRKILLPLAPEYIGYADVGLSDDFFVASRPEIEHVDEHTFKYHIDFDNVHIGDDIGAICVSRPTNPTGNVLTDQEMRTLHALARQHDIPLIIDNAYGMPFPHIVFSDAQPLWDEQIILCLSLSKLGLPGVRTGIIVASEEIIQAIAGMNAILSLAPSNCGATLVHDLVRSGEIITLSREIIQPFYRRKVEQAITWLQEELDGTPFFIHKAEGAFFLWLWFDRLPITSQELYERLKRQGVIVVPGHYFFPGLDEEWRHKQECIRMSYAQDEAIVREGIRIIGQEVRQAYRIG